jgi:HAE1 family hydrophobic/amphiphilic exporter-1
VDHFFVRRPVVAIVISIVTVLVGAVSMRGLPIAKFPDVIPPDILVQTTYTGADALTIEQSVTAPLEQQINGADNMLYMKSTNANDGTMEVRVTFAVGTDRDTDNVLVQNRVAQANAALPPEVKAYGLTVQKVLAAPSLLISLYSPKNTHDAGFLSNYATLNLRDALLRVRGVGQANIFGAGDYAMRIWVDPDRMARLGLTFGEIQSALQRQNSVNPSGKLGAEPAPPGQEFTYTVRAQGRLVTAEEFGDVVVRATPDGSLVKLKDVARIELGAQLYTQLARYNGAPAALMAIYQSPGTNALEMRAEVARVMEELERRFPADLDFKLSLDTTLAVQEGIDEIVTTLFEAVALVILVVFIFLQSWRATLIPLLTVPVALIGAFALFPLLGFSINTLSLFGLVLAIGLVVDDAIVVVEAVEHHIEHGLSPREATNRAMKEVSGPVVAIALILASVFIPVAFVGGVSGRLYQQFALTIAISVVLSAINALTLSPALCSLLLRPRAHGKGPLARAFALFNRGFEQTTGVYVGISRVLARKVVLGVLLLGALAVVAGSLGKRLPTGFVPDEDQGFFYVQIQLPDGASLQRTDVVARKVERILAGVDGIQSYNTVAGFSLLSRSTASYTGFFFVTLKPWDDRKDPKTSLAAIVGNVNRQLAALPEARAFAFLPPAIPGVGTASGFSFMLQDRAGGSVEDLAVQVDRFVQAARKRPEIGALNTAFSASVPQAFVKVDRDKALKQGVDLGELYSTLQVFMGGAYINDFNRFGRQWRVYLQAEAGFRTRTDDIGRFYVRNRLGQSLPLSSLVTTQSVSGPEYTNRFNLYRSAELTGTAAPGYSSGQAMDAMESLASELLPPEYGYSWNALSYQQKIAPSAVPTFLLAILLVFLILAAQYESWSLPFSVLLGTPVAVAGAFAGLVLSRMEFNVYGQIGLVMLIGLAAKNAILIVEFAKAERERGTPLVEAAMAAARLRLRPILMTAFAFILGCTPLLSAGGAGGVSRKNLGTVVVYGSLAATLIGIFLTPALFVLIERLGRAKVGVTAAERTRGAE